MPACCGEWGQREGSPQPWGGRDWTRSAGAAWGSVVVAAGDDADLLGCDFVDEPVLVVDALRPEARHVVLERFGLADVDAVEVDVGHREDRLVAQVFGQRFHSGLHYMRGLKYLHASPTST